jgi:hypothetical protein
VPSPASDKCLLLLLLLLPAASACCDCFPACWCPLPLLLHLLTPAACPCPPPQQVCEALERSVETLLPPLAPAEEGGAPRQRTIETWAPKKVLKVWNPK